MANTDKNSFAKLLQNARYEAGYASRDKAAEVVPYSTESIGRHERNETGITPENAVIYATCYKSKRLLMNYCTECPVGIVMGKTVTERHLPHAVLRYENRLSKASDGIPHLKRITDDGNVSESDDDILSEIIRDGRELGNAIDDICYVTECKKNKPCKGDTRLVA